MTILSASSNPNPWTDISSDLIANGSDLKTAILKLQNAQILAIDCETTGLDPHLHTIRLLQIATPNHPVLLIDLPAINPKGLQPLQQLLKSSTLKIAHNAKFDWQFLTMAGLEPSGLFFDTQLAYRVLTAGLKTNLSLQSLAQKLLGMTLDKTQQSSDWSQPLTEQQLHYAALDAAILLELYPILLQKLKQAKLLKTAQLEFHCLSAVAQMELNGMLFDLSRWQKLAAQIEAQLAAALKQIQ